MTRLIDADKLNIYDVSPAYGTCVMGVTEEDIDEAPTVDAIPVEWLYDLAEKKEEEKDIKLSAMIKGVVALWHREMEKQNE